MIDVIVDYDSGRKKGILITDYLSVIREHFSVEDKGQTFKRRFAVGYRPQTRKYVITPQGRFEPRLVFTILEYFKTQNISANITFTDSFKDALKFPSLENKLYKLNFDLRAYQSESVTSALTNKSGVILLPTSAGKTLTIATLVMSILEQHDLKVLILVPNIQLVTQTYSDFIEYGINEKILTKWTGGSLPDPSAKIFISNIQILMSEKQDTTILQKIGLLVVDEVHTLKKSNQVNKIIDQIPAKFRYGFTGTLPPELIDQWNIFGKIGRIIYEEKSIDLRQQGFITDVIAIILKVNYKTGPTALPKQIISPTSAYEEEITFLQTNPFRNNLITKLVNSLDKNTLILIDRINHGEVLHTILTANTSKKVYFVHGKIDIEEREMIRQLMENENDVICIAISKIFSTGINIKNLHNIVFAAIGKAKIKIIQSIGRSLRKHASKKRATIFDIGDCLKYGNAHLQERIQLYQKENIEFKIKDLYET